MPGFENRETWGARQLKNSTQHFHVLRARMEFLCTTETDLAAQLRKRPDIVGTALNLLLGEQKVQKAPVNGYWKLNG
jgi:hypothetical protein